MMEVLSPAGSRAALEAAVQSGAEILTAEKYLPLIYEKKECLLDYFGSERAVFIVESSGVSDRLRASLRHGEETAKQHAEVHYAV